MSRLLFVDVETTGVDVKDRICEIAVIIEADETLYSSSLCKSPKKIGVEAMAMHHITNEMLKESPSCDKSTAYAWLQENNTEENILISHNMGFTLSMLEKEGFALNMKVIDTLRCVKALIPECGQFSLQFLRYELLLYKDEKRLSEESGVELNAHRALSDALHVKLLYQTLLEYATLSQLIELSSKPVLMDTFPFGKYTGHYIEEIAGIDSGYLAWMLENIKDMDEDLEYSIKHYLKGSI